MPALHTAARLGGATGLLLGGGILLAGPAAAHVTVSPGEGTAGAYTVVTVSVPHGCDGSATTKVAIKVPRQLNAITPTVNPGWTVAKKTEKLATPIKGEEGEVTERTSEVVYTAKKPLPDGYRDAFELSFQVPDRAGTTMYFPAIQTCVKGQTAWVERAAEGQPEPEHPAPSFRILAAGTADDADADADPPATAGGAEDTRPSGWGIAGTVTGVLGLLLGGTALARTRRQG